MPGRRPLVGGGLLADHRQTRGALGRQGHRPVSPSSPESFFVYLLAVRVDPLPVYGKLSDLFGRQARSVLLGRWLVPARPDHLRRGPLEASGC